MAIVFLIIRLFVTVKARIILTVTLIRELASGENFTGKILALQNMAELKFIQRGRIE